MRNPTFLALSRHRIFYFRWPVPKTRHPIRRPSSVKVSLQTRDPKFALYLARILSYAAERLLASGALQGMRYEEMRRVVQRHFAKLLADKKAQILERGRLTEADIAKHAKSDAAAQTAMTTGHPLPGHEDVTAVIRGFMRKHGLALAEGSDDYKTLRREFMQGYRDYNTELLAFDRHSTRTRLPKIEFPKSRYRLRRSRHASRFASLLAAMSLTGSTASHGLRRQRARGDDSSRSCIKC